LVRPGHGEAMVDGLTLIP